MTLFLHLIIITNKVIRLVVSRGLRITKVNKVLHQPTGWVKSSKRYLSQSFSATMSDDNIQ